MPEESKGAEVHPSVRHELSDASLLWVGGTVGAALVLGAVILLATLGFFHLERSSLDRARTSEFPLAPKPSTSLPPQPRLEQLDRMAGVTAADVQARDRANLEVLNSYGPAGEKGYIHIPIARAMKLLANRLSARDETRMERSLSLAATLGLLSPSPHNCLAAPAALLSAREHALRAALERRQNGLVTDGESNSGRLFKTRRPAWAGR